MISQKNFLTRLLNLVKTCLFAIILVSAFSACAQKTTHATITYSNSRVIDTKGMERDILYYINQYRNSIGLSSLQMITAASEQAIRHSIDMAGQTTPFGHEGFYERID